MRFDASFFHGHPLLGSPGQTSQTPIAARMAWWLRPLLKAHPRLLPFSLKDKLPLVGPKRSAHQLPEHVSIAEAWTPLASINMISKAAQQVGTGK